MTNQPGARVVVQRLSGFGLNRVGVPGPHSTGFPLSLRVEQVGEVYVVNGTAARLAEIADVLLKDAQPKTLVFDVGHNYYSNQVPIQQVPLAEIAGELGLEARGRDIAWAAAKGAPSELLMLSTGSVATLVADLPLYDIVVVDVPEDIDEAGQDEIVLTVNTERGQGGPTLQSLAGCSLLFDGHDDCYLYVETRDPGLAERLLGRLLTLLAGSSLVGEGDSVIVHEPANDLVAELLADSHHWVGWPTSLAEGRLVLGLRAQTWRLSEPIPAEPTSTLAYDLESGCWTRD